MLPDNFFDRPKKGFALPTSKWINNELKNRLKDAINSEQSRIFLTDSFREKLNKGKENTYLNKLAYPTLVFLEWARLNKINSIN